MRRSVFSGCLAFALAQGSALALEVEPYIVNGSQATINEYPYMANLIYDRRDDLRFYGNYCGATILDEWHVLTAAHCLTDKTYNDHTTVVLQMEKDSDFYRAQKIPAEKFYWRDDYRDGSASLWANDIAIIKLEYAIQGISSNNFVRLPASGDAANYRTSNASFVALGHGNTSNGRDNSSQLLQVNLSYVSSATCSTFGRINASHLCTSGDYSAITGLRGGICQGDSGGPLVWFDGNVYRQIGIASFGPSTCGNSGSSAQGVFTEVLDYVDWIGNVIAGNVPAQYTVGGELPTIVSTPMGDSSSAGAISWLSLLAVFFAAHRRQKKGALPR
ncbi:trypsin-like serine protease [Vibrio sp. SCSIO 43136]|uniref:S1 family peptidase n=1 Tax=Vibrio sp. SCSIO 43136 TaxID=2819101 RepID=UPI002075F85D|nr:trypsin-like serine protease [Vibrio sp. SCSIO 43136]USD68065.1 trypsin-like serine protease [Vibrio sp. SCSIO 43136]